MARVSRSTLIAIAGAVLLGWIAVATVIPTTMELRSGMHWETEHFLAYLLTTSVFILAWPGKPLLIGALLTPLAGGLEALQGLTPDRTPDLPTALAAMAGVLTAALIAKLMAVALLAWKRRKSAGR